MQIYSSRVIELCDIAVNRLQSIYTNNNYKQLEPEINNAIPAGIEIN